MIDELLPKIIDKTLISKKFDYRRIHVSLLKETCLDDDEAWFITNEVVRHVIKISEKIKTMTSPMVREITNVTLLQYGFEKARLQYTRIGLPYHDISELPRDYDITDHVLTEFGNVKKMIEELEENEDD